MAGATKLIIYINKESSRTINSHRAKHDVCWPVSLPRLQSKTLVNKECKWANCLLALPNQKLHFWLSRDKLVVIAVMLATRALVFSLA